ncbi:helix-turn-helix domain-containing protein [Devosia salina]|uniref:Helix-turn-helix domain-containing protein n=1 Tax=Devosia salina TaxID=2860336 RepID=A0ABX8WAJ1_9HYPH|nr:helix-turn-helix domain-containing protein [Devosia salina]QYO75732.1 helix-turn-helix domain-containing protein [Devosia salina]
MSKFGKDLIEAMGEALAHVEGAKTGVVEHRVDLEAIDARSIRKSLNLTQEQMALMLGTSTSGYRKWEQGERQPSGAARTLLRVMEKEPEAVLRALTEA